MTHTHRAYAGVTFTEDEVAVVNAICELHDGSDADEGFAHTEELALRMGWDENRVARALHSLGEKTGLVRRIESMGRA